MYPLTEEIRLQKFGSPDSPIFLETLLSDGDSRLLQWKTIWIFWDSRKNVFESCRDSSDNLSTFWQSVIFSPISSVCGVQYSVANIIFRTFEIFFSPNISHAFEFEFCILLHDFLKWQLSWRFVYGVAVVSRIDWIIGLFCKRAL